VAGGRFSGSGATGAEGGSGGEPGRQRFQRPRGRGGEDRAGGVTACGAATRWPGGAAGGGLGATARGSREERRRKKDGRRFKILYFRWPCQ
jgi:hypothetical protein